MKVRNLVVKICNLVYIAGAAVAVAGLVTQPLLSVKVSVGVPGSLIQGFIQDSLGGGDDSDDSQDRQYRVDLRQSRGLTDGMDFKELLANIPMDDVFDGLKLTATVQLPSLLEFAQMDEAEQPLLVKKVVGDAIKTTKNDAVDFIVGATDKLIPAVAKSAATQVINAAIGSKIAEAMGKQTGDAEVSEEVKKVTAEVTNLVNNVWNTLTVEKTDGSATTVDDVKAVVTESIDNVFDALADAGVEGFVEEDGTAKVIPQEQIDEIGNQMAGMLKEVGLADEDGNITDINAALTTMLEMFMPKDDGSGEQQEQQHQEQPQEQQHEDVEEGEGDEGQKGEQPEIEGGAGGHTYVTRAVTRDEPQADDDTQIREMILGFIDPLLEKIPLDSIEGINLDEMLSFIPRATFMIYIAITALAALPWILFALFTLGRTLRKRKIWAKPWFIFFICFLELILGAGLFFAFKYGISLAMPLLPAGLIPEPFDALVAGVSISFEMHCLWASFVYLAMIPFTIVYIVIAHPVKKDFKQYKKDKKAAKRAGLSLEEYLAQKEGGKVIGASTKKEAKAAAKIAKEKN